MKQLNGVNLTLMSFLSCSADRTRTVWSPLQFVEIRRNTYNVINVFRITSLTISLDYPGLLPNYIGYLHQEFQSFIIKKERCRCLYECCPLMSRKSDGCSYLCCIYCCLHFENSSGTPTLYFQMPEDTLSSSWFQLEGWVRTGGGSKIWCNRNICSNLRVV